MAIDDYVRPKREMPNRVKSDQQLKDEAKMRRDVEQWKKDNVVTEGSPLYTRDEYKGLSDKEKTSAGVYLTRISYGSF